MEKDYECIARFIYTAYRYGGDMSDVHNWMADSLGIARPPTDGEAVPTDLYAAFFARYAGGDMVHANYQGFVDMLRQREV